MESLRLESTRDTPKVDFNATTGELLLEGTSIPENPTVFYGPIFKLVESFCENSGKKLILILYMKYFNTASSKSLLDLLELLEEKSEQGKDVHVVWKYKEDDDELLDAGEELLDLVEVSYELQEVS